MNRKNLFLHFVSQSLSLCTTHTNAPGVTGIANMYRDHLNLGEMAEINSKISISSSFISYAYYVVYTACVVVVAAGNDIFMAGHDHVASFRCSNSQFGRRRCVAQIQNIQGMASSR